MRSTIQRWGNSLALRIPKHVSEQSGLAQGAAVDIEVRRGEILIRPVQQDEFTLDTLLNGITPENLHNEVDTGDPVGNEVW